MNAPVLSLAMNLPPERAVEYFRSRGLRIGASWQETAQAVRAGAFSVAAVTRADVLQDIRASIDRAVAEGITYQDWLKTLRPQLAAKGWLGRNVTDPATGEILPGRGLRPRHLETVFRTNTQAAYMAGRYKAMVENSDRRPNWMYVAVLDNRTRPRHRSLNGRVFRWDDPAWSALYPPNGYNCRCRVRALTDDEMTAEGLSQSRGEGQMETVDIDLGPRRGKLAVTGYRDPLTRELFAPDPGFDHAPAGSWGRDVALARTVQAIQSPEIRMQTWQALNGSSARAGAWRDFVSQVTGSRGEAVRRAGHVGQVLGFVDDQVAGFARRMGDAQPTRVAVMTEKQLLHADNARYEAGGIRLEPDDYAMLPAIVAKPDAVFWDALHRNVVLVRWLTGDQAVMLPITAAYREKKIGRIDAVVNAFRIPAARVRDRGRFVPMADVAGGGAE